MCVQSALNKSAKFWVIGTRRSVNWCICFSFSFHCGSLVVTGWLNSIRLCAEWCDLMLASVEFHFSVPLFIVVQVQFQRIVRRPRNDLCCVGRDVKPYSLTSTDCSLLQEYAVYRTFIVSRETQFYFGRPSQSVEQFQKMNGLYKQIIIHHMRDCTGVYTVILLVMLERLFDADFVYIELWKLTVIWSIIKKFII